MTADFSIAGRPIGPGQPVYVIAEISSNHGQHYEAAVELVRGAHAAGADAVKLQTYTADTITIDSDAPAFTAGHGSLWEGTTLHALYETAYMPWEWQPRLKAVADELGMDCFSSPFDPTAVEFLMAMDVPAFKIASFELVDLPLIRTVARTGRPMIMLDRDGDRRRDRRGRRRRARRRSHPDRTPQVHERLPVAARGGEPPGDPGDGRTLGCADRPVRPHPGDTVAWRSRPRGVDRREEQTGALAEQYDG